MSLSRDFHRAIEGSRKDFEDYLASSGLLTETDRRYLLGDKQYDKRDSERDRRQVIRDRIRVGLLDLNLIANRLDPADRELVFNSLLDEPPADKGWNQKLRGAQLGSVEQVIGWLYTGVKADTEIDERTLFERAILRAEQEQLAGPFGINSVSIEREYVELAELDTDEIAAKIERGVELSTDETRYMCNLLALGEDAEFQQALASLKVDIGAKLDTDASLSKGESLVAIAKFDEQPGEYRESALLAALDPDVRRYLGV